MSDAVAASFIESVKDKVPKLASVLLSAAFFCGTIVVNVTSKSAHFVEVQAQQERRISDLEGQVKNDLATRREMQDFKGDATERLNRIEDKLDKELQFHRNH